MTVIQCLYQDSIRSLRPRDRVARSVAAFHWARGLIARRILATSGAMGSERLKWEVAMRMYGADAGAREIIERQPKRVSD